MANKAKPSDSDTEKKKITDAPYVIVEDEPITESNVYTSWNAFAKIMDEKAEKYFCYTTIKKTRA
ncbi:MAG: hypothetical protein IPJ79_20665 [Bacteroidetes bacterium]|nr:hypothetical protein [Bacteroidota bacterium]